MSSKTERQTTRSTRTTIAMEEHREYRAYCGCCDLMWLVATVEGLLKLLQWISTFLAFVIILATFDVPISHYKNYPEYNFMLFVAITSWIIVTLYIMLKLPHLLEKFPLFLRHPIVIALVYGVAALAFLAASSVVIAYGKGYSNLEASAACGYIAMFLFLFDLVYILCRVKRATRESTETKTVERVEKGAPAITQRSKPEDTKEKAPEIIHEFPE